MVPDHFPSSNCSKCTLRHARVLTQRLHLWALSFLDLLIPVSSSLKATSDNGLEGLIEHFAQMQGCWMSGRPRPTAARVGPVDVDDKQTLGRGDKTRGRRFTLGKNHSLPPVCGGHRGRPWQMHLPPLPCIRRHGRLVFYHVCGQIASTVEAARANIRRCSVCSRRPDKPRGPRTSNLTSLPKCALA